MNNSYIDALAGLRIEDPVRAFFDWCRERENIRIKRERGDPPPWTRDPVLQRGRFLNVFREDDKGTKSVIHFAQRMCQSIPTLLHALFFARWCNRNSTLDKLDPRLLNDADRLRHFLLHDVDQPWCSEAYPVVGVHWQDRTYDRLSACVDLFPSCLGFLETSIQASHGDVVTAANAINTTFGMTNDFPIFMALTDIAWFEPKLISPDSPVPTGIGSAPFLDLLQRHLGLSDHHAVADKMIALQKTHWPEARRRFTPIDIEYIGCECRKYYSYVNGTKKFEGRNLFAPA